MLPAGLRQRDQTKKSPTGPYDREALMQHLEKVALEHKDREDLVPFTGEKKGARRPPSPAVSGLQRPGSFALHPVEATSDFCSSPQEKPSWQRNRPRFRSTSR